MKKVERIFRAVCEKYDIHGRQFTKEDFYRICEGEGIELLNKPEDREFKVRLRKLYGLYIRFRSTGEKFIYLKSFFGKNFKRHVAFHELGHHFCGHLAGLKSEGNEMVRSGELEREADHFAYLATGLKRRRKSK